MPKLKPGTIVPSNEDDAAINAGIAADPDTRELDKESFKRARPASETVRPTPGMNNKVAINIRYDRDLVEAFKATGEGWQTRMNDALRDWARKHRLLSR